ncbi:MAG: CoA transferase, partial [Cellulomonas sp.]|nr:CoA transferase [Cellulomonas sp.]
QEVRPGAGNRDAATAPSSTFACRDGHAYVYAGLDKHWARLRTVVDGLHGTHAERLADPEPYEASVAAWTAARSVEEVCRAMDGLGIAAGPVSSPTDAVAELHRRRPGAVATIVDGAAVPQFPAYFDGARIPRTPAPALTQEALA